MQNVPSGEEREEMAVFVGYSVSFWRNSAVACVQTPAPLKKKKSGTMAFHKRLSPRFFLRGGGRLYTGYSAKVQRGKKNKRIPVKF